MKRRFVQVLVLLRIALRGLQTSAGPSMLAVVTIALALLLAGAFALLVTNMGGLLDRAGQDLQVVAYLERGVGQQRSRELAIEVAAIAGVESVALVSPDQALERFRETTGGAELLEGLDENPLPGSLKVALAPDYRTPDGVALVSAALEGLAGVDELAQGQEWVESYARAVELVRSGAWVVGGVLAMASLLIVANTIRLAVYARRDEIEIFDLVGGSRSFVRAPYLIEGLVQGTLGGVIALLLLFVAFHGLAPRLEYGLALFLGRSAPRFFDAGEMLRLVFAGAILGTIGAAAALWGLRR